MKTDSKRQQILREKQEKERAEKLRVLQEEREKQEAELVQLRTEMLEMKNTFAANNNSVNNNEIIDKEDIVNYNVANESVNNNSENNNDIYAEIGKYLNNEPVQLSDMLQVPTEEKPEPGEVAEDGLKPETVTMREKTE
ncbi:MAG: hypothetical protein K1X92_11885, partial [Bacteroidia bacterium]|nr:hypothetical protein [Bacteroidia bacterium]